jgi:hypothetical protein
MEKSETTASGWQVSLGDSTIPENIDGQATNPRFINEKDGFSPLTPAITHLEDATAAGLIHHTSLESYLDADAKTVIIDLDTGERVPHFAEVDASSKWDFTRILMLHPVRPLTHGGRYIVGIRGVVNTADEVIEASPAFTALRDELPSDDPRINGRRDFYGDTLFPALDAQGFARADLQIAWDFVVGSQESINGKALWMRDDMYARMGPDGPAYVIDTVELQPNATTAKRIKGQMTVPLYTDIDGPTALLNRDPDGMPYAAGETTVPFTIIVPQTAIDDPRPLPLLQYGHGLLGRQDEVHSGYLSAFADTYGYIVFAVDWTGMKEEDAGSISLMLVSDLGQFSMIPERSQQGFMEFLAAMKMMRGAMVNDPELQATDPTDPALSIPLIDPEHAFYYGNSQGGIMGGAYIGLSPDISRATLGVGGTPYHLLLSRSADFDPFFLIFKTMYPDPIDVQFILAMNQTLWDPGEAAGFIHAVNAAPLADTPPKDVLLQVAIGDAQVSTLGAHIMARAYGAKLIEDPVRPVWGLDTVPSGHTGSALVEFDYGLSVPDENLPPDSADDPHGRPRQDLAGQEQMHLFFETGVIHHICEGPCGPGGS